MPCIECKDVDKCCAASALLQSIALEEAAIAHILNAEGEKLQKAISISCDQKDLIEVTIVGLCPTYIKMPKNQGFQAFFKSGPDGNRTRVQKPIHCPSTSVAYNLTFPLRTSHRQDARFSSFMIRPPVQSLAGVVSYIVEAWVLMCRCTRSDSCH